MKYLILLTLLAMGTAHAGTVATSETQSGAVAIAGSSGNPEESTIYRAPAMAVPPSMFGGSNQNCGASQTGGISTPWGAIGGSNAQMMLGCNTRTDVATLWQMGAQGVAKLLMFCNGRDQVRVAFEQSGGVCPAGSTADGMYTERNPELEPNAYMYGAK